MQHVWRTFHNAPVEQEVAVRRCRAAYLPGLCSVTATGLLVFFCAGVLAPAGLFTGIELASAHVQLLPCCQGYLSLNASLQVWSTRGQHRTLNSVSYSVLHIESLWLTLRNLLVTRAQLDKSTRQSWLRMCCQSSSARESGPVTSMQPYCCQVSTLTSTAGPMEPIDMLTFALYVLKCMQIQRLKQKARAGVGTHSLRSSLTVVPIHKVRLTLQ